MDFNYSNRDNQQEQRAQSFRKAGFWSPLFLVGAFISFILGIIVDGGWAYFGLVLLGIWIIIKLYRFFMVKVYSDDYWVPKKKHK